MKTIIKIIDSIRKIEILIVVSMLYRYITYFKHNVKFLGGALRWLGQIHSMWKEGRILYLQ